MRLVKKPFRNKNGKGWLDVRPDQMVCSTRDRYATIGSNIIEQCKINIEKCKLNFVNSSSLIILDFAIFILH
jgi:hypothetical protein